MGETQENGVTLQNGPSRHPEYYLHLKTKSVGEGALVMRGDQEKHSKEG